MAYKQKINPRTGKFNLVGAEESDSMSVTSTDGSVKVTETEEGVDLGVNTNSGPLKSEFDTLHEIYNKYKRRPSGNIDTEGIENHWIFPQDALLRGSVNLPMPSGSSQYGDWLLVAICTSGNNGAVDTEGRITLKSFDVSPNADPQLSSDVKFPTLDFRWRLLRGENTTEPDNGVPPQLFLSDLTYVPTEYKECKGQTVSPSAPKWSFVPDTDFMCVCHKVTSTEYGVSKFTANAGYSYVYYVFLRHKIWHCYYASLEFTRIVTGSPVQCSYWTNNYHHNAAMESPATALWNNVMKSPAWTQQGQVSVPLSYWTQYCDRSDNRGAFRDIKCQTLFGETAEHGVTALPTGTRVMAQTSVPETTGMTQSADNATDSAFHNLAEHLELSDSKIWDAKTWTGLTYFAGSSVWTDGTDIYYSYGNSQYVLDKSTSTWIAKTWTGLTSFVGSNIWTDGTDVYYSSGSTQYVLDKSNSTWSAKTWTGLTSFDGRKIWTDGTDVYHSSGSTQYVLSSAVLSDSEFAFRRSSTDAWKKIKMADIERYINARQRPLIYLDGYDFYMGMFPKRADFIMRGDSYNINFHITSFDSYTEDNPFRVFGNMGSDGGSTMYFEEGNGEGGGRSFSFGSWETQWYDWNISLFMFEFWMVDSSHARLRVTEYSNGYDGIAGRSEVIDPDH